MYNNHKNNPNNNRETGIRTVRIDGVPVQVSNQKGGLVIIGKREHNGRSVQLMCGGNSVHSSFKQCRVNGETVYAATFSRVSPGNWETIGYYPVKFSRVTLTTGWAEKLDWR